MHLLLFRETMLESLRQQQISSTGDMPQLTCGPREIYCVTYAVESLIEDLKLPQQCGRALKHSVAIFAPEKSAPCMPALESAHIVRRVPGSYAPLPDACE